MVVSLSLDQNDELNNVLALRSIHGNNHNVSISNYHVMRSVRYAFDQVSVDEASTEQKHLSYKVHHSEYSQLSHGM